MLGGASGDDAIAITGHYSAVAAASPGEKSLVLAQQRCNLPAGPGDRMQAYGLDVADLGTAVIASIEDAANPLPPGAKIDAFNCDADGQGYIKVTPSSHCCRAFQASLWGEQVLAWSHALACSCACCLCEDGDQRAGQLPDHSAVSRELHVLWCADSGGRVA